LTEINNSMRVLLFGGGGQVGHALQAYAPFTDSLVVVTRRDCDLTDPDSLRMLLRRVRPDIIVNAAAYTAVDKAESDRESCFAVNAAAPGVMAAEAAALGAKLVHYSTDYVFDGNKTTPYVEEDPTAPRNIYGASKLAGEEAITRAGGEFLILRTSWVYSNHGANFLKTMLRLRTERPELRIVADQRGAPTSADAIADATIRSLTRAVTGSWLSGVYHMTAAGATSWYEFAKAIFSRAGGPTPALVPIGTADYPTPAARPANSLLANDKFAATFGFRLPDWEQQLDAVMAARAIAG
jgi:dTDP-4-dehydrorhamnose reductase